MSYIYVLSNPAFPHLVKIGKTAHTPAKRAGELYSTGVPDRFTVEGSWVVPDSVLSNVELAIHRSLNQHRYSHSRKFFEMEPKTAIRHVNQLLKTNPSLSGQMSTLDKCCLTAAVFGVIALAILIAE